MPSKARDCPLRGSCPSCRGQGLGTHLRLEDSWVRPDPGHQATPCCAFGQREDSSRAPAAPGPRQPGKDSGGCGLCRHSSATWQKEQTGVLVALESTAGPPGWEPPLGATSSIVGRTLELAEALHRSQCAELCTEASWPPIVGVVLEALAVSETREVQSEREKVTDSVIPMSSSHVTIYL